MGHLATGPTELREAVGQGALEKESSDMGGSPLAEGTEAGLRPHLLFSVLAAERRVLGARTKGRGHTGWWQLGVSSALEAHNQVLREGRPTSVSFHCRV